MLSNYNYLCKCKGLWGNLALTFTWGLLQLLQNTLQWKLIWIYPSKSLHMNHIPLVLRIFLLVWIIWFFEILKVNLRLAHWLSLMSESLKT